MGEKDIYIDTNYLKSIIEEENKAKIPGFADTKDSKTRKREKTALYTLLVRQTLIYAQKNIPYYQRMFKEAGFNAEDFSKISDLSRLPLIGRKEVQDNHQEFINNEVQISNIRCTSGTTFQRRLPILSSAEETKAALLLNQLIFPKSQSNQRKILLRIFPYTRRILSGGNLVDTNDVFPMNIMIDIDYPRYLNGFGYDYFDVIINQIFEHIPLPNSNGRVSIIHATPPFLIEVLSDEIVSRQVNLSESKIETILCTGGLMTERLRKKSKTVWNADIITSYSFSEINGFGVECPLNYDTYHFTPAVYLDVVDSRGQPVEVDQEGMMVVTSLYPFQQAQPFIRYLQGDIVKKRPFVCECGFIGQSVHFVGRTVHSIDMSDIVPANTGKLYIGSADVIKILDEFPEIPHLPYHRFKLKRIDTDKKTKIHIHIELVHTGSSNLLKQLERNLSKRFFEYFHEWSELLEEGRIGFEFKFCNKGHLSNAYYLGT